MSYFSKQEVFKSSKLLLPVHGGIGRNIMATAVVRAIKKQYPNKELSVIAGCPEVFQKNPRVKRVHNLSRPSFVFEDYFKNSDTMLLSVEPYQHKDYISRKKHFVECWCEMLGVEFDGIQPEMFYNISEQEIAKDYLQKFDRRMILFQHQGGKVPEQANKKSKIIAKSGMYKRNLPENIAQEVTDKLIKLGFMVGSVGHPNQFLPKGAEAIKFQPRAIIALIPFVAGVISIDSFLLHASAISKDETPAIGVWGGTNPLVLGYPWMKNLTRKACDDPMCHRPNSYLWDFEQTGFMWDCPHNDICMNYDSDTIVQSLKETMKGESNGGRKPKRKSTQKNNSCGKKSVSCDCKGKSA